MQDFDRANDRRFAPGAVVEATKENVYCELDGESVILNMADGVYYGLNQVGHRIWEIIQTPTTIDDIVATLLDEYEIGADQCRTDVEDLIADLLEKGLVAVNAPAA